MIAGFETVEIPYVNGPQAAKPKVKVVFDYWAMGKLQDAFHDVIDSPNSVVLVYDTRYEGGVQCLPPDRGKEPFTLTVPSTKKTFRVWSFGQNFSHGVIDHIVLLKHAGEMEPME